MSKTIEFHTKNLKRGIDILANAVKVTLGPQGRNVILSREYNPPLITKDGVSVAVTINSDDPIESLGIQLAQEVARKTVEVSGDGTTTSTLLLQAIVNAGLQSTNTNPIKLKKGIEEATNEVINFIKKEAKPITKDSIYNVATISANNDETVGKIIADAINKVGQQALITVEESKSTDTYTTISEGLKLERGYISPYFVTNMEKMIAEYEDCAILVTDYKITNINQIKNILEVCIQNSKPLLIICDDLTDDALSTVVVNKMRGIKIVAIKAPASGDMRKEILQDIAIVTGATYITKDQQHKLEETKGTQLGFANILVTKDTTTLSKGNGKKEDIQIRINQIKEQIKHLEVPYEKERYTKRYQKLESGVATIYVGGTTESERREKKDRVDDALCAVKAAIEEGIVPGGATTYIKALKQIKTNKDKEIQEGKEIIKQAIQMPLTQILLNCGYGKEDIEKIIKKVKGKKGFNAKTEKFEDLVQSGVIDPAKVLRVSLENASSVATLVLTTSCVAGEKYQPQPML